MFSNVKVACVLKYELGRGKALFSTMYMVHAGLRINDDCFLFHRKEGETVDFDGIETGVGIKRARIGERKIARSQINTLRETRSSFWSTARVQRRSWI